jgi:hypothetical protein
MRKVMMVAGLIACMLMVFACGGGTATPTEPPLATDTPEQPPTDTEESPSVSTPTDTPPPIPSDTPTLEPTITPTTPIGTPLTIRFVQMIDGATGWGIGSPSGDDNQVLLTQNSGNLWDDVSPPEPALASKHAAGYFLDRHTGWVVYYPTSETSPSAHTFYTWNTTNDGASWTQSATQSLDISSSVDYPPFVDFVSANTGWILLRHGPAGMHSYPAYLMRTTNGGSSWTEVSGGGIHGCNKTGMDFVDVSTGWLTYNNCPVTGARLSITTNGGATWNHTLLPEPASYPGLFSSGGCYSHSPNLLSATTGGLVLTCNVSGSPVDYFYVTTNGGASWISVPYPGGPLYMMDTVTMFAMGREQHRSVDGGVNWTVTSIVSWDGQFSFVTPLYVWGVAEAAGAYALVHSVNGTSSWAQLTPMLAP